MRDNLLVKGSCHTLHGTLHHRIKIQYLQNSNGITLFTHIYLDPFPFSCLSIIILFSFFFSKNMYFFSFQRDFYLFTSNQLLKFIENGGKFQIPNYFALIYFLKLEVIRTSTFFILLPMVAICHTLLPMVAIRAITA